MDQSSPRSPSRRLRHDFLVDDLSSTDHRLHQRVLSKLPPSLREDWMVQMKNKTLSSVSTTNNNTASSSAYDWMEEKHTPRSSNSEDSALEAALNEFLTIHPKTRPSSQRRR